MIYLIGGPPKCGKTTLAKKLSKKMKISWISTDTLGVVARECERKYLNKTQFDKKYPHSAAKGKNNDITYQINTPKQIMKNYIKQGRAAEIAIEMTVACELADGDDYIIEGYHLTPQFVSKLIKKFGKEHFNVTFLIKKDKNQFLKDIKKSSTSNDWIIKKTHELETFSKIADMIVQYSLYFYKESLKYSLPVVSMDKNFTEQLNGIIKSFTETKSSNNVH